MFTWSLWIADRRCQRKRLNFGYYPNATKCTASNQWNWAHFRIDYIVELRFLKLYKTDMWDPILCSAAKVCTIMIGFEDNTSSDSGNELGWDSFTSKIYSLSLQYLKCRWTYKWYSAWCYAVFQCTFTYLLHSDVLSVLTLNRHSNAPVSGILFP